MEEVMIEYSLYLESGPKKKKTMVHVLDLLGLVVRGSTTDKALAAVPASIRKYLTFLHDRCGESLDASTPFSTRIATHVMEGSWLGEGDPTPGFPPDFLPLDLAELTLYVSRLRSFHGQLFCLVEGLSLQQLEADPPDNHRSLRHILEHAAESEYTYLRMQIGADKEIQTALKVSLSGSVDIRLALPTFWQRLQARTGAMTAQEMADFIPHGITTWSARRALRRMLEHNWEHLEEIRVRLDSQDNLNREVDN
jgi:DinB superfamily